MSWLIGIGIILIAFVGFALWLTSPDVIDGEDIGQGDHWPPVK